MEASSEGPDAGPRVEPLLLAVGANAMAVLGRTVSTASRSRSTSEAVSVSVAALTSSFRVVPASKDPA